jgi:threonine-phosphate decarboxylase
VGCKIDYYKLSESKNFALDSDFSEFITDETDMFFLCNPNNPTGCTISADLLNNIAKKCEETNTVLCVDECFLPFLRNEKEITLKHRLEEYHNLIVLRAFTKIYAMAGLRLGYALSANKALLEKMRISVQPWNTSLPAQQAGIAALSDDKYIEKTWKYIEAEKKFLLCKMKNLTEKIYEPSANYIFFKSEKNLKEKLLNKKILIRSCENYRNLGEGYYRIGIRTHAENEKLIERWEEIWQNR